jgi:hypothetical protein
MHVFSYGSLVCGDARRGVPGVPVRLHGWQRGWGVAMDNTRDLRGYKHYLDRGGGRPALFVAFLDIRPAPGHWVNGLLRPVDAGELVRMDARERNYRRVELGAQLLGTLGPVWTYVGVEHARERRRRGLETGRLAVAREYHDRVLGGFARLGSGHLEDFHAATAALPCPLLELRVVAHRVPSSAPHSLAAR